MTSPDSINSLSSITPDSIRSLSLIALILFPSLALIYGLFLSISNIIERRKSKKTIIPEYLPPEHLSVLEIAVLLDNKLDLSDLNAELLDLSLKGVIRFDGHELELINKFEIIEKLSESEKDILNILFEDRQVSKMNLGEINKLSKDKLFAIRSYIYGLLVDKSYYAISPFKQRSEFYNAISAGFLMGTIFFFVNFLFSGIFFYFPIAICAAAVVLSFFGMKLAKKTKKGKQIFERVLGYKYFIREAEKDRILYLIKNEPATYYFALPYAYLYHVIDKWKAEKDIEKILDAVQYKNIDSFDPDYAESFTGKNFFAWFFEIWKEFFSAILAIFGPLIDLFPPVGKNKK